MDNVLINLEEQNDLNLKYVKELKSFIKEFAKMNCDNKRLLEGINEIFIKNEDLKSADTLGFYNSFYKTIVLLSNHINKFESNPVFVFLHELGHHHVEMTEGLDKSYDWKIKNKAYYREEIKANKFALKNLEELNKDNKYKNVIRQVKLLINYLNDKLNGVIGFYFMYDKYQINKRINISSITINGKTVADFFSKTSIDDQLILAC